ncbi:hypothetical protein RB195_014599 [Necator americanus]|uniref:Tc1-like transposase DDE domain-containing protein n=1 Tax=Necator americanus TaxID=51031 RepID=A0ABR1E0S5_NECAM
MATAKDAWTSALSCSPEAADSTDWTPLSLEIKNESSTSTNKRAWQAGDEMPDPFVKGLLQRLADDIRKEHPKLDNIRLLYDNARRHIAKKTSQKILELGWDVLSHPPYSPDLALSDYHLLRSLQHHPEEKRYDDHDCLENDFQAFFASKSSEFYAKGIRDIERRWEKVVDVGGDYFVE